MKPASMLLGWVLLTAATAGAATVSSHDLARCAAIVSGEARLACYDALAHRTPDVAPPNAAASPAHDAVVQTTPAVPSAASPAQAATAAPAATTLAAADDPKNFGLSPAQRHVAVVGPKEESGRIVSLTGNQAGHSTFVLDNGQMWSVLDDDGWLSNGDQVTIKRATLGSFLLTAPSHHTYRVHRVQ